MMNQEMVLQQKQTLNLTPQMHQSIQILQMNTLELIQWIEKQALDNPVLEIELNQIRENTKSFNRQSSYQKDDLSKKDRNHQIKSESEKREPSILYSQTERDQRNLMKRKSAATEQSKSFQYFISDNATLAEHLFLCLKMVVKNDIDYKIGEYLIGNMNQNGYLEISCLQVAQDLAIPEKRVKLILGMIQNLSTPGLGARSVKECLLLQLKHLKLEKKEMIRKLIILYLPELSQKKFNKISKALHLSYYDIQELLDVMIKNFDPKPGRKFYQNSELKFLVPDLIVKKIDEEYEIIENKAYSPSVKINSIYKNMLFNEKTEDRLQNNELLYSAQKKEYQKTISYLEKKLNSAHWIIRCIQQRRKTVLDITHFLIQYQREFLEKGVCCLKPLSMREAADALGLHESTISRAIKGKRIQLPRGFYELKFFFSNALPQKEDKEVSNQRIKNLLKKYILSEDTYHPYSDQQLTDLLKDRESICISRRTVTKYRKLLGMDNTKIRRRYKKQEVT